MDDGDEVLAKALSDELARVYERLRSPSTTTVGQYVAVVLVSGLVAVTRVPEAFAAVPVFWSAWMLHALILDLDSVKLAVYARWLERRANGVLGSDVFVWESAFAKRSRIVRPLAYYASVAYWAVMNLTTWVIAVVIMSRADQPQLAWLLVVTAVAVYAVAGWTLARRGSYNDEWEAIAADIRVDGGRAGGGGERSPERS